jgi:hypothetical protein
MGSMNSTGFQTEQIQKALAMTGVGKFLSPLDHASDGSVVVTLRESAKPEEYASRVFEFSSESKAIEFINWLAVFCRGPVVGERVSADEYNRQFDLPQS